MIDRLRLAALPWLLALAAPLAAADGDHGGGGFERLPSDHLAPETRQAIAARLGASLERLRAEGRIAAGPAAAPPVQLAWPLAASGLGASDFGVHGISGFVDEDPAFPGALLDYECGARTYDTASGYNHQGTDIFTWPFAWNRVDGGQVLVVAGADGVLLGTDDGNPDRNCGFNSGSWNAAYVLHADGSVAWYGHLKLGSVTTKSDGDAVATGETLGVVASSGNSTGPHLHLELYDDQGQLIDPWQGACNTRNPVSSWLAQRPYFDSAINKLMTGSAAAVLNSCPDPDVSNEAQVFAPGDTVWFTRFYRDQLETQPSVCTVLRPDSSVFRSWTAFSNAPHYAASWWWNSYTIGAGEPLGPWSFEVEYEGVTYRHPFWLAGSGPWLLRNTEVQTLMPPSPPLSSLFAAGDPSLDLLGADGLAGPGEGDDDDAYVPGFASGGEDPEASVLADASRPLVFYQLPDGSTVRLVKRAAGTIAITY